MNYVYKLIFNARIKNQQEPYYYIGSKSNATYRDGLIIDRRGRPYYGSSTIVGWMDMIESGDVTVEIIKEFDEYTDALNYEAMLQKSLDVVADTRYFNLSIATVNTFTDPAYASYKHTVTGKTVRLPRTHPAVLSGAYVGVSRGRVLSEEERKKRGRSGEQNGFYGRTHTNETKQKISDKNSGRVKTESEITNWVNKVASKTKSDEHRKKIGRKGMVMLKNKYTHECVRVPNTLLEHYDLNVWVNPFVLSENKSTGSRWINDGITNKKLAANCDLPDGWMYGRIYTNWKETKKVNHENNKD